jgi:hypothetical protein
MPVRDRMTAGNQYLEAMGPAVEISPHRLHHPRIIQVQNDDNGMFFYGSVP